MVLDTIMDDGFVGIPLYVQGLKCDMGRPGIVNGEAKSIYIV